MNIYDLLKKDKDSLLYLDFHDVRLKSFRFPEINKEHDEKRTFYQIEGIDDYILKDSTVIPFFFNETVNRKLLMNLVNKQKELPDIGFPIGYMKKNGKMNATIIPYYKDAESIQKLNRINVLKDLQNYYNHDNDVVDNLICLLVDILEILSKMVEKKVYYLDVKDANFVVYNNDVKVIDFDPGFMYFKDRNFNNYDIILRNYAILVYNVIRRYGFKDVIFNREDTFIDTEHRVLSLRKELKGKYGV